MSTQKGVLRWADAGRQSMCTMTGCIDPVLYLFPHVLAVVWTVLTWILGLPCKAVDITARSKPNQECPAEVKRG